MYAKCCHVLPGTCELLPVKNIPQKWLKIAVCTSPPLVLILLWQYLAFSSCRNISPTVTINDYVELSNSGFQLGSNFRVVYPVRIHMYICHLILLVYQNKEVLDALDDWRRKKKHQILCETIWSTMSEFHQSIKSLIAGK